MLSGQDSRRGTFSHRHATLVDYETSAEHVPLKALGHEHESNFWVYDSLLSEYAVLGFEYGYSVAKPDAMVLWEAQFGDFANGAQIIIDQFVVAAKDKWDQDCGLVMLLPHGYEGQGPEHSSARIEQFLLLAAEDNIQVCNATTAAQFFHLIRRQSMMSPPALVIFTPKSLLRSKHSRSNVTDLMSGTFEELLGDRNPPPAEDVERVIFCSGKVALDLEAWSATAEEPTVRSPASNSSTRGRSLRWSECWMASRTQGRSSGFKRSQRTWAPGTSSRAASTRRTVRPMTFSESAASSRVRLRSALPPFMPRSFNSCSTRRSAERARRSTQRNPDDRLEFSKGNVGVDNLDRLHTHGPGRFEVDAEVVEKDTLASSTPSRSQAIS